MGAVSIGVDIGQRVDPTAIAVVEREERRRNDDPARTDVHHVARFLERLSLGTPYPEVARRLVTVVAGVRERTGERPRLFVDATGVGQPVMDLLAEGGVAAYVNPVYFTHGDRRVEERDRIALGKAWLVSRLQALLQTGRLHLPSTAEAKVLAQELIDYEIKVDQDANDKYGAFKVGTHDDLVTALGLATQDDGDWLSLAFASQYDPRELARLNRRTEARGW
jgi:hypothetical protein